MDRRPHADPRFVSAGHVVYPGDVERVFLEHPAIADAAVVGIPASRLMTRTSVPPSSSSRLESEAAAAELLSYARTRLPSHAIPASIEVVDRLPRNTVGKLRREELRDLHGSRLAIANKRRVVLGVPRPTGSGTRDPTRTLVEPVAGIFGVPPVSRPICTPRRRPGHKKELRLQKVALTLAALTVTVLAVV